MNNSNSAQPVSSNNQHHNHQSTQQIYQHPASSSSSSSNTNNNNSNNDVGATEHQQLNYIILDSGSYRQSGTSNATYLNNNEISTVVAAQPIRDDSVITTTAATSLSAPISSSLTSQCILCREICVNKNDLIQHLRNHLADDNKTYVINATPPGQDTNGTTVAIPNSLVDLLKLDNKELCA